MKIKSSISNLFKRFIKIHGTPNQIAWGMAIGFFIAMSPTMGIQTVIAVALASVLGVNKISAAIGVWLSNPVSAPFIYGFNYMVGAKLLGYPLRPESFNNLLSWEKVINSGKHILYSLIAGGVLVGVIISIPTFFVTKKIVETARKKFHKKYIVALDKVKRKVDKEKIN